MTRLTFDLQDFSIADSQRLLEQGFQYKDLISLYHDEIPIVANEDSRPDSE